MKKEELDRYKTRVAAVIVLVAIASLASGFAAGQYQEKMYCGSQLEYIGSTYQKIISDVSGIDVDKVMKSYEYCYELLSDPDFNEFRYNRSQQQLVKVEP